MNELLLGVNIDHIATLRQARGTQYPDPVEAAILSERAGADAITLHMREDLRHIQPRDVRLIKEVMQTKMNLELAVTDAMIDFALQINPEQCCLVPEKREELTTEGGLDVSSNFQNVKTAVAKLKNQGSEVAIFIDPDFKQIELSKEAGADAIEIHTGCYADAKDLKKQGEELLRIRKSCEYAAKLKLIVNAGHGLHYHNVKPIAQIKELNALNIGHSIMARAFFTGLSQAVKDMLKLIQQARKCIGG